MAPHSSTLAWQIPWMEEPGRLQSMGSLRVGHYLVTSLSLVTFMHWRRQWQPTPVFLPGESQGRGSLVGCRLWGRTESDTTEVTQQQQQHVKEVQIWVTQDWCGAKKTTEAFCAAVHLPFLLLYPHRVACTDTFKMHCVNCWLLLCVLAFYEFYSICSQIQL